MNDARFRVGCAVLTFCGIVVGAAVYNPVLVGLAQAVIPVAMVAAGYLFGSGFAEKWRNGKNGRNGHE